MLNKRVGNVGEAMAVNFLKDKGYKIVELNYANKIGEIDIIASDKGTLVFVEVKLRKSDKFAQAAEFVDFHKQNRLRSTAEIYLSQNPTQLQPRFDVVEIYAPQGTQTISPEIHHLEDAF